MNEELTITHERVDDLPVLLAQLERMQVAPLLDAHFPPHGNWQGLSLGQVASGWLTFILSEANHRSSHVEPWAAERRPATALGGARSAPHDILAPDSALFRTAAQFGRTMRSKL